MYQPLLDHIRKFVKLSETEEATLLSCVRCQKLKKKELLLKEGQICRANYFILQGCCCLYMVHETGSEQVTQFGIENWWITDYVSLESQKPSRINIRAVEDTLVVVLDKHMEEELFSRVPQLERYFRLILQRAYAATLQRIQFIFSMSGEERYLHFATSFPAFVQRVPQYILASYLGFTPEFLSKVRAKKH
jgi:CRP/FNR family transcriptional regulator